MEKYLNAFAMKHAAAAVVVLHDSTDSEIFEMDHTHCFCVDYHDVGVEMSGKCWK